MSGGERQRHGFIYQAAVIKKNNYRETGYTDKWDAYDDKNRPVSIKCIKKGADICFGDFERQNTVTEDFILHVAFWEQSRSNITEQYDLIINADNWNSYFGNCAILQNAFTEMAMITNSHADDQKWDTFCLQTAELYNTDQNIIKLRFKRDHKKQKRLQCAISYANFINQVVASNSKI